MVCTDILLTKEEAKSGRYRMQPEHKKHKSKGWSGKIMARKRIFSQELGRPVCACFYFDQYGPNECTIYENRPWNCREFDCRDKRAPKVHGIWLSIKTGKMEALCTDA